LSIRIPLRLAELVLLRERDSGGTQRQQNGLSPTVTVVVTMGARYTGIGTGITSAGAWQAGWE
jgi:hypothetical protein